jgi:hypothetical protein
MNKIVWIVSIAFFVTSIVFITTWNGSLAKLIDGDKQLTDEVHDLISNYIVQHNSSSYYPTEKQFEVHKVYGTSHSSGILTVYMWSYYNGFNKATGSESQAGHSLPAVISLMKTGNQYKVIEYTEPQDGSSYPSSLKKMFPRRYLPFVHMDAGTAGGLQPKMDEKVEQWLRE